MSEQRPKGRFLGPYKFENHTSEGKGKEKRMNERKKGGENKNSNSCTLSFYNGYFGDYWPKKL